MKVSYNVISCAGIARSVSETTAEAVETHLSFVVSPLSPTFYEFWDSQ